MHLNIKYIQRHKNRGQFSARGPQKRVVDCQYIFLFSVFILSICCTFYCRNFFRMSNISDLPKTKPIFFRLDKKKSKHHNTILKGHSGRSKLSQTSLLVIHLILFYQGYFSQEKTHYTKSLKLKKSSKSSNSLHHGRMYVRTDIL